MTKSDLNQGDCWISDMGVQTELRSSDGTTMTLPRYGVWGQERGRRRPGVVEVSDDLAALMTKYEVPQSRVFNIERNCNSEKKGDQCGS